MHASVHFLIWMGFPRKVERYPPFLVLDENTEPSLPTEAPLDLNAHMDAQRPGKILVT